MQPPDRREDQQRQRIRDGPSAHRFTREPVPVGVRRREHQHGEHERFADPRGGGQGPGGCGSGHRTRGRRVHMHMSTQSPGSIASVTDDRPRRGSSVEPGVRDRARVRRLDRAGTGARPSGAHAPDAQPWHGVQSRGSARARADRPAADHVSEMGGQVQRTSRSTTTSRPHCSSTCIWRTSGTATRCCSTGCSLRTSTRCSRSSTPRRSARRSSGTARSSAVRAGSTSRSTTPRRSRRLSPTLAWTPMTST